MTLVCPSWLTPTSDFSLAIRDVHLWRADLERSPTELQSLATLLSVDEQQRADRYHFELHRQRFIAGRGILRLLLGRYLQCDPRHIQFAYSAQGKPAIAALPEQQPLSFNLSHSENLALYAVSRDRTVGIDLEYLRPMPHAVRLAERFFSATECAYLQTLSEAEQSIQFLRDWSRKEAYLKATGEGISKLEQLAHAQLLTAVSHWSVQEFTPAPGYVAAIAIPRTDYQLHYWQFQHWQFEQAG